MGKNSATACSKSKKWGRSYQISQLFFDLYLVTNTKLKFFQAILLKFKTYLNRRLFMKEICCDQIASSYPLDETHLDAVRGLIELWGFDPRASKSRARRSDKATSDKDKQICFVLMPRTWFNMEEFRLE